VPPLRSTVFASLGLLLLVGACTGERPQLADEVDDTTTTTTEATTTTAPAPEVEVAQASGSAIDVFDDEDADEPSQRIEGTAVTSAPEIPIVFLVKQVGEDRLEVYLPSEPPGSTGWVDLDDVTRSSVEHRVEVDVGALRLRVYDSSGLVLDEPIALGPDRPEPAEGLYLNELVQPPDADGPYGAYVYGLSGSASVRSGLEQGEGVVGIHGTDDESLLGQEVEQGSVAVAAAVLTRLVDDLGLPLGTPVEVVEGDQSGQ